MAANPKRGRFGHLYRPQLRMKQLRAASNLTLEEAGRALGVGKERARQLFSLYGVTRTKPRRGHFIGQRHKGKGLAKRDSAA